MNYQFNLKNEEVITTEPDIKIKLKSEEYILENCDRDLKLGIIYKIDNWNYQIKEKINVNSYLLLKI